MPHTEIRNAHLLWGKYWLSFQLWKFLCLRAQQGNLFMHFESKIFWEKLENLNIPNVKKKKKERKNFCFYIHYFWSQNYKEAGQTLILSLSPKSKGTDIAVGRVQKSVGLFYFAEESIPIIWSSHLSQRMHALFSKFHVLSWECHSIVNGCQYVKWTLKAYLKFWKPQSNPPMPASQTHILCNFLSFSPFQRPRGSEMSFMIRCLDLRNLDLTLCCNYLFSKRGRDDSQHCSKYVAWSWCVWRGEWKTCSDIFFQRQGRVLLITSQSSPMCFWLTPQNTWNILFWQIQI